MNKNSNGTWALSACVILALSASVACAHVTRPEGRPSIPKIQAEQSPAAEPTKERLLYRLSEMIKDAAAGNMFRVKEYMVRSDYDATNRAKALTGYYRPASQDFAIEMARVEGELGHVIFRYKVPPTVRNPEGIVGWEFLWKWIDDDWHVFKHQTGLNGTNPNVKDREEYIQVYHENQTCHCDESDRKQIEELSQQVISNSKEGRWRENIPLHAASERMCSPETSWWPKEKWQSVQSGGYETRLSRAESTTIPADKTVCEKSIGVLTPFPDPRLPKLHGFMCGWTVRVECQEKGVQYLVFLKWIREDGQWKLWGS